MLTERGFTKRLRRREHPRDARFLTFSCFQRLPLLAEPQTKALLLRHIARARELRHFRLFAYVIMPEHVHLLLHPDLPAHPVPKVLATIKRTFAAEMLDAWRASSDPRLARLRDKAGSLHFWQRGGGHDRNIRGHDNIRDAARYIHNNPVRRGLVAEPSEYPWSSAPWYAENHQAVLQPDPIPR